MPIENAIKKNDVTTTLRTSLWNVLNVLIWEKWHNYNYGYTPASEQINAFCKALWFRYFKADLDSLPDFHTNHGESAYDVIKRSFFEARWYEVFDFIEFTSKYLESLFTDNVRALINDVFETENSAYRLIGSEIVEITGEQEILALEEGLASQHSAIRQHLQRALELLSDRKQPDYRNSIKESISAVEAACRIVVGLGQPTLGQALKKIGHIHPALSEGLSSIYGYTSDEKGIRHSLMGDPSVGYDEAKFMLVACSAFSSFLISKTAIHKNK